MQGGNIQENIYLQVRRQAVTYICKKCNVDFPCVAFCNEGNRDGEEGLTGQTRPGDCCLGFKGKSEWEYVKRIPIRKLVKMAPSWAANRIIYLEERIKKLEEKHVKEQSRRQRVKKDRTAEKAPVKKQIQLRIPLGEE